MDCDECESTRKEYDRLQGIVRECEKILMEFDTKMRAQSAE